MILKPIPTAITKEGLLGKSKLYIQRAFRAKLADDLDEYQLWASLALELLGKAALAGIHPSLVVDPTHYESLFAASGLQISPEVKTISASTLYKRVSLLSKYFDSKVKEFCDTISLRRNAELHSGEAPFQQMHLAAWEGRYWHSAQIILAIFNASLDEWIGADQAQAPKELVNAALHAGIQAAHLRVAQAKEHFEQRSKKDRDSVIKESKLKHIYHYPKLFKLICDHEWPVDCPSCSGRAFLSGDMYDEQVLDSDAGPEGWVEEVEKSYSAEEFRCPTCELQLNGRAEIEAVRLEADLIDTESREREYEPEYGNC